MPEAYDAAWESLDQHDVPQWFKDAKLGIFVHWYPNAVPGYGFGWYAKHMHEAGHPIHEYHRERYGEPLPADGDQGKDGGPDKSVGEGHSRSADGDDNGEGGGDDGEAVFEYRDFVRETEMAGEPKATENFTADDWSAERWADLFEVAGARYVVAVAEHHDGFPMWDADYTKWTAARMGPQQDVVGKLADATRDRGLKFSGSHHRMYNYYDPRYAGAFGHPDYQDPDGDGTSNRSEGPDEAFVDELQETLRNMLDHHRPDILWLDGDWAASAETFRTQELLAEYYNMAKQEWDKEVVANDRLGRVRWNDEGDTHGDFYTPEYTKFDAIVATKWEATRALGDAWTYDRTETDEDLLSVTALVRNFVDIVSKNGNMLINVGPDPSGRIPDIQAERLRGIGDWLDVNGEAIYGSHYWVVPEDTTEDVSVRYTAKGEYLYAVLFGWPKETATLSIPEHVTPHSPVTVELLGYDGDPLNCEVVADELRVDLPERPPAGNHAYTLKIQIVEAGENAFEAAEPPPEGEIIRSTAELRAMVDDDYEESTWEIDD